MVSYYECRKCGFKTTFTFYGSNIGPSRCPTCGDRLYSYYDAPNYSKGMDRDMEVYNNRLSIQKEGLVGQIQQINKKLLLLN